MSKPQFSTLSHSEFQEELRISVARQAEFDRIAEEKKAKIEAEYGVTAPGAGQIVAKKPRKKGQ